MSFMHAFSTSLLQILSPTQGGPARTTEQLQRGLLLAADVGADKLGEGLRHQLRYQTVDDSTDLALGLGEAELALLRLPRAVAGSDSGSTQALPPAMVSSCEVYELTKPIGGQNEAI